MDFKVFLSDDALSDLERIVAYIAPHNAIAAERMGNQLLDAALSLRTFPERGRVVPEFRRPELRDVLIGSSTGQTTRIRAWKLSVSGTGRAGFRISPAGAKMREPLALSLLNDFLYCNRRAALKVVEGWRSENQHTARGDIVHEHADLRGYEVVQGVKILRALPVFSDRLGLNGKCDIVEQRPDGSLFPVEFKVGKRRQWENDDAQLCAQTLCLEEMFHTTIPRGAIFHADSKRRRDIEFSPVLRTLTEKTIGDLHALLDSTAIPRAEFREACEQCSLYEICLPRVTSQPAALHHATERLFET